MELDDLKHRWQVETQKNITINKQSMEALHVRLESKTSEALSGLKKKYEKIISILLIGIFMNVVISPFHHFLLGDDGPVFRITFGGLLSILTVVVLGLVVVMYYWLKYTSVSTGVASERLEETLKESIGRLKRSRRQEGLFIVLLVVMTFVIGRATSQYLGNGDFFDILHPDILTAFAAGLGLMSFYLYKRMSAYNKNIRELEQYLQELKQL